MKLTRWANGVFGPQRDLHSLLVRQKFMTKGEVSIFGHLAWAKTGSPHAQWFQQSRLCESFPTLARRALNHEARQNIHQVIVLILAA